MCFCGFLILLNGFSHILNHIIYYLIILFFKKLQSECRARRVRKIFRESGDPQSNFTCAPYEYKTYMIYYDFNCVLLYRTVFNVCWIIFLPLNYFSPAELFFSCWIIFFLLNYFSPAELFFSRWIIFLPLNYFFPAELFFSRWIIFLPLNYFSPSELFFSHWIIFLPLNYFSPAELFFCRRWPTCSSEIPTLTMMTSNAISTK